MTPGRRKIMKWFCGMAIAGVPGCQSPVFSQLNVETDSIEWPQYGQESDNQRAVPKVENEERNTSGWRVALGSNRDYTPPVIRGNSIFVAATGSPPSIIKVDATTGEITDEFRLSDTPLGTPAILDDIVILFLESGVIQAIPTDFNKKAWSSNLPGFGRSLALVGMNDRIFVPISRVHNQSSTEPPGGVIGIDARTGDRLWATPIPDGKFSTTLPAVSSEAVFVTRNNLVVRLDQQSGAIEWEQAVPTAEESGVALTPTSVIVLGRDERMAPIEMTAIERDDGEILWRRQLSFPTPPRLPAIDSDRIYVKTERHVMEPLAKSDQTDESSEGKLVAFTHEGRREWAKQVPPTGRTSPVVVGNTVSVRCPGGVVTFDRATGTEKSVIGTKSAQGAFLKSHSVGSAGYILITDGGELRATGHQRL